MKTLVIGGGMAGLTYGIVAVKNGIETVICERNSRVGKKIAVTGNGKCNVGNANADASCFNHSKIAQKVLNTVSVAEYVRFLNSCGIYTFSDGAGRMYPLSESASNVVDCLRFQFEKHGGKLLTDTEVLSAEKRSDGFCVQTTGSGNIFCHKVVLACGSGSGVPQPNVKNFCGNFLTETAPSLVPVKIADMDKSLNGLRAKATVTLFADGAPVATEKGEVQFKDYGLSGICIFNLSARIARDIVSGKKHNYQFSLDLVPEFSLQKLEEVLQKRLADGSEKVFYGILHNKIAQCVVKRSQFTAQSLAKNAKSLTFRFEKLLDYSMSQVTCGGIAEKYLDDALTLPNGICAVGEVLDVDGLCGGNNLYFAAASALSLFDENQRERAYEL